MQTVKRQAFKSQTSRRFQVGTLEIFLLLIFCVLVGKLVRWTIMKDSLINMSKGWGYPLHILNDPWSWAFFGFDEISEGDIGQGDNVYTFFKIIRILFFGVPDDFYTFEICITFLYTVIYFLILNSVKSRLTLTELAFCALGIMVNSVYCFSLGKEPFQAIYFILLYAVLKTDRIPDRRKILAGLLVILLSTVTFRTYYALIIVFSLALILWSKRLLNRNCLYDCNGKVRWRYILLTIGFLWLCYLIAMLFLRVANPSLYDRFAEALLLSSDATASSNTYIENLVTDSTSNVFLLSVEYILATLRLLFPLELIPLGPKYWFYVLYQLLMTFFSIRAFRNYRNNTVVKNVCLVLFIGYVFCSGAFEVDFGAWVRHCSTTFPVLLLMSGIIEVKDRKIVKNEPFPTAAEEIE